VLAENGLERGKDGLKIIMMCELPSNVLLAEEFLERFDGFSIGSNDLTQLTLGLDRDSSLVAASFDERNPAVKKLLAMAIAACQAQSQQVRRHLRPGTVGSPRSGGVAHGTGHRQPVVESRYRRRHLEPAGAETRLT
jgi:phosphoenolpyruvate synthase/pyruvate phosphate dikinase